MENPLSPKRVALTYALIILALRLVEAQAEVFNTWFGRRCYERSRGEMILMVYEKALSRKNVVGVDPELKARAAAAHSNGNHEGNGASARKPSWTSWILNLVDFRWLLSKRSHKYLKVGQETKPPASMGKIQIGRAHV